MLYPERIYIGYKDRPLQGHMIYPSDDLEVSYWNGEEWVLLLGMPEWLFEQSRNIIVIEASL